MIAVLFVVALLAGFAHVESPEVLCREGRMTLIEDCGKYQRAELERRT